MGIDFENFTGEVHGLEQLHPYVWRSLLKHFSLQDKKNLRLVNWTLYNLVNENDDELRYLRKYNVTPEDLKLMADYCPVILGLDFQMYHTNPVILGTRDCDIYHTYDEPMPDDAAEKKLDEGIVYLAKKHAPRNKRVQDIGHSTT